MFRPALVPAVLLLASCGAPAQPARPTTVVVPEGSGRADPGAAEAERSCAQPRAPKPIRRVAAVPVTNGDPRQGHFGMADAIAGMSGDWPLVARIETPMGVLRCELWDEVAPITVANFVGLARGVRPFQDPANPSGPWITRPAFDGSSFHRVIPGFMIQGGDPTRTGRGGPGYVIPDEIDESVSSDHAGLLYMANAGPNTNGMQFFVLDAAAAHIQGNYTAFGECEPTEVVSTIAAHQDTIIERVRIEFGHPCRQ